MLPSRLASTLIETVIALALVSGALLLVSALLQRSSRYQLRSEALLESAQFADSVLDSLRLWAKDPRNYDSNWSYQQGRIVTDPDFPQLQAQIRVDTSVKLYSPDNPSEIRLFPNQARLLPQAVVRVKITAGPDLGQPLGRVQIWSDIAAPSPQSQGAKIEVTIDDAAPVAFGQKRQFTAQAKDGSGRPLPQCCFDWRVLSQGGQASRLQQSRDGRTLGLLYNKTRQTGTPATTEYASGDLTVQADGRINGRWLSGSLTVTLLPGRP